jgi:hypothetical protein
MNITVFQNIEKMLIDIRGERLLLDSDIARIYGVETKRINEAVGNNLDKFPAGYVVELNEKEVANLRSKISTANFSKTRVPPKAFTERGLYMLATILKSPLATQATLSIIETFAKMKALSHNIKALSATPNKETQKNLMQKGGEIIADILGSDLEIDGSTTSFELNFAVLKFKHTVTKAKKTKPSKNNKGKK